MSEKCSTSKSRNILVSTNPSLVNTGEFLSTNVKPEAEISVGFNTEL
jgi:hypothetical protein